MVPLDSAAAVFVQSWLGGPSGPGLLDLYQALGSHRVGLWGDHPRQPRSVLLARRREGQLVAFGAGEPGPAIDWLARQEARGVTLRAPSEWWGPVETRVAEVERRDIVTLIVDPDVPEQPTPGPAIRRLAGADSAAFAAGGIAPPWALASWLTFEDLIGRGAGFIVPFGDEVAAMAWTYSQAGEYEAVGVVTTPRFRRLGLGRAVAFALIAEIRGRRGKVPLWTTTEDNEASRGLAESLGVSSATTETLLQWRPGAKARPRMA